MNTGPSDTHGPETRRALLGAAARVLQDAGIGNAGNEARWLLEAVVEQDGRRPMDADQRARFAALVSRRARREPLQHVLGRAAFRYLDLRVGPGVFVPRPETETLVELVLAATPAGGVTSVVDLCSGSGAIALALASENPVVQVTAVEKSRAAMGWLQVNLAEQKPSVRSRVHAVLGDVESDDVRRELVGLSGAVDVVVSNPPYVPSSTVVDIEVGYDPPQAVFAGSDGMALMPALAGLAEILLRPAGLLALEHSPTHAADLASLLRQAGWLDVTGHHDLTGRPRFLTARRAGRTP